MARRKPVIEGPVINVTVITEDGDFGGTLSVMDGIDTVHIFNEKEQKAMAEAMRKLDDAD